MDLEQIINSFNKLHQQLNQYTVMELESVARQAEQQNPWFTENNFLSAYKGILSLISEEALKLYTDKYGALDLQSKNIGLITAGNIPGVGFHDILICLLSGASVEVKLSSEDRVMIPFLMKELKTSNEELAARCTFIEKLNLNEVDGVIATGSNNTSRYFEQYFSKKPNVIRKSRTSLAILTGEESDSELDALVDDIVSYFGLGCRNVSKLLLKQNTDLIPLLQRLEKRTDLNGFSKYDNNYLYYKSIYLVNREEFLDTETILIKETKELNAPISVLYYQRFDTDEEINQYLQSIEDQVQCVVGKSDDLINFGEAQSPTILEYADGVDVREFIDGL